MNYNNIFLFFTISLFFGVFSSCQQQSIGKQAATTIIDSTYLQNVLVELGSDKYMGRMPGTAAEPLTINYIKNEFEKIGLQPGNGDSYFQEVPLATITATPDDLIKVKGAKENVSLQFKKDIVTSTQRLQATIEVKDTELVFCGFGIVAPEYLSLIHI